MDRRYYAEVLRAHAKLTWSLSRKARDEGNIELADELNHLAEDTEMRAMSTWPVQLRSRDRVDGAASNVGEASVGVTSAPAELKPIPLKKKTAGLDAR